jgi:PKD repeat protein
MSFQRPVCVGRDDRLAPGVSAGRDGRAAPGVSAGRDGRAAPGIRAGRCAIFAVGGAVGREHTDLNDRIWRHALRKLHIGAIAICLALAWPAAALGVPTWLASSDFSPTGNDQPSDTAMGAGGGAAVVWMNSAGSKPIVQADVRAPYGTFGSVLTLSPAGQEAVYPQVAEDAAGEATAVWANPTAGSIEAATIAGGVPSDPVTISGAAHSVIFPTIAVDERGDAIAAWCSDSPQVIEAAFRPAGGSFGTPVAISASGEEVRFPRAAIDAAGDATVAWLRSNGANEIVEAALRPAGGSFGAPQVLSEGGENAQDQSVAMNAAGDTAVTWLRSNGTDEIVQAAVRPAEGSFRAPVDVSPAEGNAQSPAVALDEHGEPTVVWSREADVQVSSATAAGVFPTVPLTLAYPGLFTSIAEDPAGDTLVGYFDPQDDAAEGTFRPAGGLFSAPQQVSPAKQAVNPSSIGSALALGVAIDAQGDGVFGFDAIDGSETLAGASLFDSAGPLLTGLSIPATTTAGRSVAFSVAPRDQLSGLGSTTWSFGDASTASGASVTHTFANPGTYTVAVTAIDTLGNATTQTGEITVLPVPNESIMPEFVLAPVPAVLASSTVTADSHGHVHLKLACPVDGAECAGTVTLTIAASAPTVAVASRVHRQSAPVTLAAGRASFKIAPGASRSVSLTLSAPVLKLLAQHHTLRLTATLQSPPNAGQSVVRTDALTVKAAAHKRSKQPKTKKRR